MAIYAFDFDGTLCENRWPKIGPIRQKAVKNQKHLHRLPKKSFRMERKMMKIEELYRQSQEFKAYVDKNCNSYGYTVQEAITHALVREVAKYYQQKEAEKGEEEYVGVGKVIAGDLGNGIPV